MEGKTLTYKSQHFNTCIDYYSHVSTENSVAVSQSPVLSLHGSSIPLGKTILYYYIVVIINYIRHFVMLMGTYNNTKSLDYYVLSQNTVQKLSF